MYIGYARVSIQDQGISLQLSALHAAGCAKVLVRPASGVQHDRPQQQAALDCGWLGRTLMVWKLDRLARRLWVAPSTLYGHLSDERSALREGRA